MPKGAGSGGARLVRLAVVAAMAAVPSAAGAVIGGTEDTGPLSRSTVMVLSSKGGVCSAVVLAQDVVLTAAHCVTGAPDHRVHFRGENGQPVLIVPVDKVPHPGFNAKAVEARRRSIDLALVRVPGRLPDRFEAATLTGSAATNGSNATLGGYGLAREGDPRSTGTFRTASLRVVEPHGPSRILVWMRGERVGACLGDSGGPVAAGDGVFAVASWAKGDGGRACGETSQGVLVGPQREWIDRTLAEWGRSARWR
jgi:Trypsin